MSYKAVIFDLGKVIIDIDFSECFKFWSNKSGKAIEEFSSWFSEDEMYRKHERGEITGIQYHAHVASSLNIYLTFDDFVKGWNSIFNSSIPETMGFIEKYKSDLKLFALTNSNALHRDVWSQLYVNELSFFDKIYCSSLIKARKPEARSYWHVLNDSGLQASEVVFVDDKIENINAAVAIGIDSVLFDDPRTAIDKLESLIHT